MGVLYLALDPAIDRLIAVKLLRVDDDALRERFLREARLAARLQHPNIVTIYDIGSHEGQPFIAMEYIAGETVAEMIQRRAPLPLLRKLELMLDACQGLAYAHKNGIVHRDIKPANLMVNRDAGVLKVLDFGIARGADSNLTQLGMLIGTPNYMAPEQVEGKPIDHRADIFALGLVLYELLPIGRRSRRTRPTRCCIRCCTACRWRCASWTRNWIQPSTRSSIEPSRRIPPRATRISSSCGWISSAWSNA